jgi:processive 1,2-diacylglycerol beta-glucosyltransferase
VDRLINPHPQRTEQVLPRVLLCAADVGCGHGRAATAIELAMRSGRPSLRPKLLDVLVTTPRWFNRIYRDTYLAAAKHLPRLNGWLYNSTDVAGTPSGRGVAAAIESLALRSFCDSELVREADLIVCTHFLCARVLSRLRGRGGLKAKLAVVVTDQHPHAVWRVAHADLFMVASDSAADEMARNGIDSSRTVVTGIPIDWRFDRQMSQAQARHKQHLPPQGKIILLTGGGLGLGGIDHALDGILAAGGDHFAVVVCGHNENLRASLLERVGGRFANRCRILGLTTKMHELMAAADLLVGKPGGLTTAEAAARGLPMVLLRPIPGQEERNAQVIVQAKAAVLYNDPFAAGQAAAALVAQPDVIDQMRHSAQRFGRIGSARAAAQAALGLCATRFNTAQFPGIAKRIGSV